MNRFKDRVGWLCLYLYMAFEYLRIWSQPHCDMPFK